MWPDLFLDVLPSFLKLFGRLALHGMFSDAEKACAGATAITGVTEAFVDWGVGKGKRAKTELDRCFPLGHTSVVPAPEALKEAGKFWDGYGVYGHGDDITVCFIGSVSSQFDIGAMIRAVRKCNASGHKVKFVVCGAGDKLEHYRKIAGGEKDVVFAGWVNASELYVLMRRSSLGLDPLPENLNFLAHVNNKAIEYMSAGLPILASPKRGVLCDLLRDKNCGFSYACGDEQELATIISELASDRDRLKEMSSCAFKLFNERFTAESVYTEMAEYLEKIAAGIGRTGKMKDRSNG
jgi:glycosyltransferase involved in cell wall biosynthesis